MDGVAVVAATLVAGLLIPVATASATVAGDASNSAYTDPTVRAMTWNICGEAGGETPASSAYCPDRDSASLGDWSGSAIKASVIAQVAASQQLNVVMLQEVCSGNLNDGLTGFEAQSELELIQADLGAGWNSAWVISTRPPGPNTDTAYTRCRDGLSGTLSDAILVKGDIDSTYTSPYLNGVNTGTGTTPSDGQAETPVLCVGVAGWASHICTVHIGNLGQSTAELAVYQEQINALKTAVGYYPNVVVGGDFNTVDPTKISSLYATLPECDQNQPAVAEGDNPGRATHFTYTPTVNSSGQITSGYYTPEKIDYLWATNGFANCTVEQQHADQTNYSISAQADCWPGAIHVVCTPDTGEISDHAPLIGTIKGGPELEWRLSDGTGQSAADASGTGNLGTLSSSGVSWNATGTTAHGGSATFDGTAGQIAAAGPVVDTSTSFTVSTWAYVPVGAPTGAALSEDRTNISGFILWYNAADDTWRFGMPRSDSTGWNIDEIIPTSKAATGVWTQLTATYDSQAGTETLYVNGTAVGSAAHSATAGASGPFVAGRDQVDARANAYWTGGLQDVEAFDYALAPAEVQSLATGLTAPTDTVTTPASDLGDAGCHANSPYGTVHTLTPALTVTVRDSDPSKQVHADFGIWDDTDSTQPQPIYMGGTGSASTSVTGTGRVSVTVPTLIPGHLYGWYAKADDGTATSSTSAVCHFYAAVS